jgi:hypothetical protein
VACFYATLHLTQIPQTQVRSSHIPISVCLLLHNAKSAQFIAAAAHSNHRRPAQRVTVSRFVEELNNLLTIGCRSFRDLALSRGHQIHLECS